MSSYISETLLNIIGKVVNSLIKFTLISLLLSNLAIYADTKSAIKNNGQVIYNNTQKSVDTLSDLFKEGEFFGRLRNHTFYFAYNTPDASHETQLVTAIGASLVYKSASFNGFDFNIGAYGSRAFFDEKNLDDIAHLKPSKDTLSRYQYVNGGSKSLYTFAQANINYHYSHTDITLGRQLVETFYTKSNDTKMIPNSFDGFVVASRDIPDSTVKLAYLTKQKLRDHEDAHSVFMVGDVNSTAGVTRPEWTQNDDSAMHKGLTYSALKTAGKPTDAPLIILDAQNRSIKNLKINFSSYIVPELLSQAMGELNYKIKFGGFTVSPGVRYIKQFDNGAGVIGGASITKKGLSGYEDVTSLNSQMIAARLVARMQDYKINLAYTNILDEADLVTPWRGFPTGGYTRSMGMYNWRANTRSYRLELVKGANKSGIYTTPFIQTSVLYIDGDKDKAETDSMFYYFGIIQNLPSMQDLQYRFRLGYRDFIGDSSAVSNYIDSRLEFNYLF